ncbi:hypothetical protein [Dankookia sp. P2]|uniref:hypothetical protein n=1 Tax=Dankookia sp. P2 TaxID=3423955 RepID=UPI003D67F1EB
MTNTTQTSDIASIKAAVIAAMEAGVKAPPDGNRLRFGKPMRDALAAARHLGIVTYDEVMAANIPEGSMALTNLPAANWPSSDVTCLMADNCEPSLAWLHGARGANPPCFRLFARNQLTGEWLLLPSCTVAAGRLPRPTASYSLRQVMDLGEFINMAACAMDAMAVALVRIEAEALTGPAGQAA